MIIIGLGNPGKEYVNTRHNVGFMVADALQSKISDLKFKILKPQTFMNKSGEAVKQFKDRAGDLVVIHDDVDLPLGTIRMRKGGSSGGHKGVQSVIDVVGKDFWRVRIGVNRPPENMETDDYVLTNFTKDEQKLLEKVIDRVVEFFHSDKPLYEDTIVVI